MTRRGLWNKVKIAKGMLESLTMRSAKAVKNYPLGQKGVTLTEMMVAMVIGVIIALAAWQFYYYQQKSFVVQDKVTQMQGDVRVSFRFMTERIVESGHDPTQANKTCSCNRFGFIANLAGYPGGLADTIGASAVLWTQDEGGLADPGAGTVQNNEVRGFKFANNRIYQLIYDGTNLQWKEFIGGIESLTLTYTDALGNVVDPLTNPQDIRKVRVQVVAFQVIQPDPTIAADTYRRTLVADAIPRNRSFKP